MIFSWGLAPCTGGRALLLRQAELARRLQGSALIDCAEAP